MVILQRPVLVVADKFEQTRRVITGEGPNPFVLTNALHGLTDTPTETAAFAA